MARCNRCELRAGCNQVVEPELNMSSEAGTLMVATDFPTRDDDIMGRYLTDRGGEFVRKTLAKAGLKDYWLTAAVKCRPPKAGPEDKHVNVCKAWLWEELKACKPKVVVTLGKAPTRLLLNLKKTFKLAEYAGRFHQVEYMTGAVAPWYGPSFLLQRGKKMDESTVAFLAAVKEKLS
jgi:uracil-DNA glycosylase family 4